MYIQFKLYGIASVSKEAPDIIGRNGIKAFKKKCVWMSWAQNMIHCCSALPIIPTDPLLQLMEHLLNWLIVGWVWWKKAIAHATVIRGEIYGIPSQLVSYRSVIMFRVSIEWWMLALSIRITLLVPGKGFIRSSKPLINWRKVIALKEPSIMFACRIPSWQMAGRTEYLQCRYQPPLDDSVLWIVLTGCLSHMQKPLEPSYHNTTNRILCSCFGSQQLPRQSKRAASNHIVVLYPGIVHVSGNRVGEQFSIAAEHEENTLTSLLKQILRTRLCVMPFRCIYLQREDSEILMPCSSSSSCNSSRYRSGCCSRTPRRYYIDV